MFKKNVKRERGERERVGGCSQKKLFPELIIRINISRKKKKQFMRDSNLFILFYPTGVVVFLIGKNKKTMTSTVTSTMTSTSTTTTTTGKKKNK